MNHLTFNDLVALAVVVVFSLFAAYVLAGCI